MPAMEVFAYSPMKPSSGMSDLPSARRAFYDGKTMAIPRTARRSTTATSTLQVRFRGGRSAAWSRT